MNSRERRTTNKSFSGEVSFEESFSDFPGLAAWLLILRRFVLCRNLATFSRRVFSTICLHVYTFLAWICRDSEYPVPIVFPQVYFWQHRILSITTRFTFSVRLSGGSFPWLKRGRSADRSKSPGGLMSARMSFTLAGLPLCRR